MASRVLLPGLLFTALVSLGACGGGGGGGSSGGCGAPGTLTALAIEGGAAPGVTGNFKGFPAATPMDVAAGGYAVFAVGTTDVAKPRAVFAALPGGAVILVMAAGDVVPDAGGGTIDQIQAVRVNPAGRVLVAVTIVGDAGGRSFGLLTADVSTGVVTELNDVVYDGQDMTGTGLAGSLDSIDATRLFLATTSAVFFLGTTDTMQKGLFSAAYDGTNVQLHVGTGSAVGLGLTVMDLLEVGLEAGGTRFAFVAERNDPGSTRGLYVGQPGSALYATLAADGSALGPGRTLDDLPVPQALVVYGSGSVIFDGVNNLGEDEILLGGISLPIVEQAVEGTMAPGTDGDYGTLALLRNESGALAPFFRSTLVGSGTAVTLLAYGITSLGGGVSLAFFDFLQAPGVAAPALFTSILPGLGERTDASRDGSFAFANVLNDGRSGAFWLIPNCGTFVIGLSGETAPSGHAYANSSLWRTDVADGVMLMLAPLVGAGSGLYRQGP